MRKIEASKALLRAAIAQEFAGGRVALVSSFGNESAVLLHMVAEIDPATPVVFVDTGKLFPETLAYREALAARLGLTNVIVARPGPKRLAAVDPAGELHKSDPDLCCWNRKVEPLDEALTGFDAWISGAKRNQTAARAAIEMREVDDIGRTKFNPLAAWDASDIAGYFRLYDLPPHPLEAEGYRSIGCAPCTRPTREGEDPRAGRWAGTGKAECGIHVDRDVRRAA